MEGPVAAAEAAAARISTPSEPLGRPGRPWDRRAAFWVGMAGAGGAVAVLLGAGLLGIIGALVAIPLAAALLLVQREILTPRLDRT